MVLILLKPISQEPKQTTFWSIIVVSTAQTLMGAVGDNRYLRMQTCVEHRPKESNGALQLFEVPHNVRSPISAMLFCTTPTCLKHGYAVISMTRNYVTHLLCE